MIPDRTEAGTISSTSTGGGCVLPLLTMYSRSCLSQASRAKSGVDGSQAPTLRLTKRSRRRQPSASMTSRVTCHYLGRYVR